MLGKQNGNVIQGNKIKTTIKFHAPSRNAHSERRMSRK